MIYFSNNIEMFEILHEIDCDAYHFIFLLRNFIINIYSDTGPSM